MDVSFWTNLNNIMFPELNLDYYGLKLNLPVGSVMLTRMVKVAVVPTAKSGIIVADKVSVCQNGIITFSLTVII